MNMTSTAAATTTSGVRLWRRSRLPVIFIIKINRSKATAELQQPGRTSSHQVIDVFPDEQVLPLLRQIVKKKDFLALQNHGGIEWVLSVLNSQRSQGTAVSGDGQQAPKGWKWIRKTSFWYFLLKSLNRYTVFLLFISAMFSLAIHIMHDGFEYGWQEGVTILIALLLIVSFTATSNFYHERKRKKQLLKDESVLKVTVEREGGKTQVSVSEILVGDQVYLKEGDSVPADGLFLYGKNLILDQVLDPEIDSSQNPFLLSGSKVVKGQGCMIVISVGADTVLGEGLNSAINNNSPTVKSLMQSQMDKMNALTDIIALGISDVILFVVVVRLVFGKHDNDMPGMPDIKGEIKMKTIFKLFEIFLMSKSPVPVLVTAVTAILIGIQHGVPIMISLSLSYWNGRVISHGGNLQNLSALADLGHVSVICIDVTGFCKKSEVGEFWIGENKLSSTDLELESDGAVLEVFRQKIRGTFLEPEKNEERASYSISLWEESSRWDLDMESVHRNFNRIEIENFGHSNRKIGEQKENENLHLHFKGAASTILGMCSCYYTIRGGIHAMENQRSYFERLIEHMEVKGLKPIAFACKQTKQVEGHEGDGLALLALLGLKHLGLEDLKKEMERLKGIGVNVILVSEDELSKVQDIAFELGIFHCSSKIDSLEGPEIRRITDSVEVARKLSQTKVVAKAGSEDKLVLVEHWQKEGQVVAFIGGLTTSDISVLRKSDVGISINGQSTELAKIVSDLTVKNVGSLNEIIILCRCASFNIRVFYQLQFTACISGLFIIFFSTSISGKSPISSLHTIWMSLILSFLGGAMMVMKLKEEKFEGRNGLINRAICKKIVVQVLYQSAVLLIFDFKGQAVLGLNEDARHAMVFNAFILCQVFNQVNAMEVEKKEVFTVVLKSYWFLLVFVVVVGIQVLLIQFTGHVLDCVRLSAAQWTFCLFVAVLPWRLKWALNLLFFILSRLVYALASINLRWAVFFFLAP